MFCRRPSVDLRFVALHLFRVRLLSYCLFTYLASFRAAAFCARLFARCLSCRASLRAAAFCEQLFACCLSCRAYLRVAAFCVRLFARCLSCRASLRAAAFCVRPFACGSLRAAFCVRPFSRAAFRAGLLCAPSLLALFFFRIIIFSSAIPRESLSIDHSFLAPFCPSFCSKLHIVAPHLALPRASLPISLRFSKCF